MKIQFTLKQNNEVKEVILDTENFKTGREEIAANYSSFTIVKELRIKEGYEADLENLEKNGDWAIKKAAQFVKESIMFSSSSKIDAKAIENVRSFAEQLRNQEKKEISLCTASAENFLYEMDAARVNEIWLGNQKITRADCLKALPHLN